MAWTAPFTAVAGSVFTAAMFNTFIRDNLLETAPSKATTPGSIFATSATNQIAERTPNAQSVATALNISATSFGDPDSGLGPQVSVTTGVTALVGFRANLQIASATARIEMSYDVSGASTKGASTTRSCGYSVSGSASGLSARAHGVDLCTLLTPGVNVFTAKYNVSSSTGTATDSRLWVLPF